MHQQLKLELSAIVISDGKDHEMLYYKNRIKEVYETNYEIKDIQDAYQELITMTEQAELSLLQQHTEVPYSNQFFEGN